MWCLDTFLNQYRRGSRGGGAGGALPPLFASIFLKSPVNWPKNWGRVPEPPALSRFSNPGSATAMYYTTSTVMVPVTTLT